MSATFSHVHCQDKGKRHVHRRTPAGGGENIPPIKAMRGPLRLDPDDNDFPMDGDTALLKDMGDNENARGV